MIISCGRITAPYNLIYKKIYNCKNCHILNPYIKKNEFSRIVIPEHDSLNEYYKDNLILTKGTLVNLEKINIKNSKLKNILKFFDKKFKIVLVLIGGNGKSSKILFNDLESIIQNLNNQKKIQIVYCFSRRTPKSLKMQIMKNKKNKSFFSQIKNLILTGNLLILLTLFLLLQIR